MADINGGDNAHAVASAELKAFAERIQRLEEEKTTISDDIKSVYGEAKMRGYDTKILKKAIALLDQDEAKVKEHFAQLDIYMTALGREGIFG